MKFNKSKIMVSVICFAVLFSIVTIRPMAAETSVLLEDVNKDGVINADDLTYIRTVLLAEEADNAYDVTGNGTTDVRDVIRIKKVMGTDGLLGLDKADDSKQWNPLF